MSTLALMYGVLATVLAAVGLYGVITYMLALRTNEIGIRMALGASKSSVMRMILNDATQVVLAVAYTQGWFGTRITRMAPQFAESISSDYTF